MTEAEQETSHSTHNHIRVAFYRVSVGRRSINISQQTQQEDSTHPQLLCFLDLSKYSFGFAPQIFAEDNKQPRMDRGVRVYKPEEQPGEKCGNGVVSIAVKFRHSVIDVCWQPAKCKVQTCHHQFNHCSTLSYLPYWPKASWKGFYESFCVCAQYEW